MLGILAADLLHADQNPVADTVKVAGVGHPLPGEVTGKDGTFNAKGFDAQHLLRDGDHTRFDQAAGVNVGISGGVLAEIERLPFPKHGFPAAGNGAVGGRINALDNKVNLRAEHRAEDTVQPVHVVGIRSAGRHPVLQHKHLADRDGDAEAAEADRRQRFAAGCLLNAVQRAGQDPPRPVGVADLMPEFVGGFGFAFDARSGCDRQDRVIARHGWRFRGRGFIGRFFCGDGQRRFLIRRRRFRFVRWSRLRFFVCGRFVQRLKKFRVFLRWHIFILRTFIGRAFCGDGFLLRLGERRIGRLLRFSRKQVVLFAAVRGR